MAEPKTAPRPEVTNAVKKTKAPTPDETKAEKFRRLVNARMPKAISRLRQLASLANKNQYEWTPEQVNKILTTIQEELTNIRNKFDGAKSTGTSWTL